MFIWETENPDANWRRTFLAIYSSSRMGHCLIIIWTWESSLMSSFPEVG
jgi:hypothetical protein